MDYQLFLYTKTRVMDWRYIVMPSFFSSNDENSLEAKIKGLYKYIEQNSIAKDKSFPLLYCFPQLSNIILLVGQKSDRVDSTCRPIWDFYGIVIKRNQSLELKNCLEQLLSSDDIYSEVYSYDQLNGFISKVNRSRTYSVFSKSKFEPQNIESTDSIFTPLENKILREVIISFPNLSDNISTFDELILNPLTNLLFFSIGPSIIKPEEMETISAQNQVEYLINEKPIRNEGFVNNIPEQMENNSSATSRSYQERTIGHSTLKLVDNLEFDSFLYTKVQNSDFGFFVVSNRIGSDLRYELEKILKVLITQVQVAASFETDAFYCFPFGNRTNIVFIRGRLSDRKDYDERNIIELYGVVIPNTSKSKNELKKVLPDLISANHIFSITPLNLSDQLLNKPLSQSIMMEINKSIYGAEEIKQGDEVDAYFLRQLFYRGYQLYLPFNKVGVNFLYRILTYPNNNLMFFAFGIEKEKVKEFTTLRIYGISGIDSPQIVDGIKDKTLVSLILKKIKVQFGKRE